MADIEIIKGADNGNPPDTLPQMYPKVNRNFKKINDEMAANKTDIDNKLESHKNSTNAHPAQHIPYSGDVVGASNTKQALDNLKQTINDLILGSGDSGPEVTAARAGHLTLGDRLDTSDMQLAGKANRRWHDVKDYGAVGDGIAVDTQSIINAVTAAIGDSKVYFPAGTYVIDQKILFLLHDNLEIIMDNNATLTTVSNFNEKMVQFFDDGNERKITWVGGRIDASNVEFGQSTDCIHLNNLGAATFESVSFYFGDDMTAGQGDSGISPIACKNITIRNCTFIGAPDVGVYISGNGEPGEELGSTLVTGCFFQKCNVGVGVKRELKNVSITDNFFIDCSVGVQTASAGSGDTLLAPGKQLIVKSNHFIRAATRAIEIAKSDFSIVEGNLIIDYGKDISGNIINLAKGIWILGSRYCRVQNNVIAFSEWAENLPTQTRAILLSSYSFDGVTTFSMFNDISNNTIHLCDLGIREETIENGPNNVYFNNVTGSNTSVQTLNSASRSLQNIMIKTVTLDFGSIPANSFLSLTASVPGAKVGFGCLVHSSLAYSSSIEYFGRVSAADTVEIRARNLSSTAIDPAATTFTVVLFATI